LYQGTAISHLTSDDDGFIAIMLLAERAWKSCGCLREAFWASQRQEIGIHEVPSPTPTT
jgi:hypothetical protein